MKKVRSAIGLFLCTVMLISCTGCFGSRDFEPKNSASLWKKIERTMDGLKSYEEDGTIQATFYNQGLPFELKSRSHGVSAPKGKSPYICVKQITTTRCEALHLREDAEQIRAYYNGKTYLSDGTGSRMRYICADVSYDEFFEFVLANSFTSSEYILDCAIQDFSHEDDGTWKLDFSQYTQKAIDKLLESTGMDALEVKEHVFDLAVSVVADASFRVKTLEIAFVFTEDAGEETNFKIATTYSAYNKATMNTDVIDVDRYTEVEDLHIMREVHDQLEKIKNRSPGKSTVTIEQCVTDGKKAQTIREVDQISYGRKNGDFCFDIDTDYNGTNMTISYKNGKQTVSAGGKTQTENLTEEKAKAYLGGVLDSAYYEETFVSDIRKLEAGKYELTLANCKIPGIESTYTSNSGRLRSIKQVILVTFQDGKLVKMESNTEANGTVGNQTITIVVKSVAEYQAVKNNPV